MLVNFGNIATSTGGKTVASGMASGLNTKEIVDMLVEAKQAPIKILQDQLTTNHNKANALQGLQNRLQNLSNATEMLRNPPGYNNVDNVFSSTNASINSNTNISGSTYLNVSTNNGAPVGNYTISNIVTANPQITVTQAFSSNSTAIVVNPPGVDEFGVGTFEINGIDVALQSNATLLDVADAINAVTSSTNVSASIIQYSSSEFVLVMQSVQPGVANEFIISDPNNILTHINFTTTAANDASFTLNNTQNITRTTNTISDLLSNTTINLYQNTPLGTNLTVGISPNNQAVTNALTTFVGAYNDVLTYISSQTQRDPVSGLYKDDAYLAKNPTSQTAVETIQSLVVQQVKGIISGNLSTLADTGISFFDFEGDDTAPPTANLLQIDYATLNTALNATYDNVSDIFQFDTSYTSSVFTTSYRSNNITVNDFTINIDTTQASGNQVKISYTGCPLPGYIYAEYTPFTNASGGVIAGPSGSVIDGLNILYTGTAAQATTTVHLSQGIADQLYNALQAFIDPNTGTIAMALEGINEENMITNTEISRKQEQLENYRENLLKQYAAVENAVSKVNSILQFLEAQDAARREYNN